MSDHDQLEEIIREIATRHGIAVSRDEPILVLQTINNRLLLDRAKAQQIMLDHYKEELEALASRWGKDAREKAERILNASLDASKEVMNDMLKEAAKASAVKVGLELDGALAKVAAPVSDARRLAMLNVVAACLTMAAAAIVMWAGRH